MGRPQRIANKIRNEFCIEQNLEFEILENICFDSGAYVQYKPIRGAQGRILFKESSDSALITINSDIRYLPKKKFVLAHELGHNELHKHVESFICDDRDLIEFNSNKRYESEANEFASELLVPESAFLIDQKRELTGFELIKKIAHDYGSSLTATSIKFVKSGIENCYLIHSSNGRIDWFVNTEGYFLGKIYRGKELPKVSNSYKFFQDGEKRGKEVYVGQTLFPEITKQDLYLYEECIYSDNFNSVLTLITECHDYDNS